MCGIDPKGNHPLFPKHPDGSRDLDSSMSHVDTWKNMEKLLKTGKTKAIGVSNYSKKYLEELLLQCSVTRAVNQIENRAYAVDFEFRGAYFDVSQTHTSLKKRSRNCAKRRGLSSRRIVHSAAQAARCSRRKPFRSLRRNTTSARVQYC